MIGWHGDGFLHHSGWQLWFGDDGRSHDNGFRFKLRFGFRFRFRFRDGDDCRRDFKLWQRFRHEFVIRFIEERSRLGFWLWLVVMVVLMVIMVVLMGVLVVLMVVMVVLVVMFVAVVMMVALVIGRMVVMVNMFVAVIMVVALVIGCMFMMVDVLDFGLDMHSDDRHRFDRSSGEGFGAIVRVVFFFIFGVTGISLDDASQVGG